MVWRIEVSAGALKQLKKMDPADARRIQTYLRQRIEPLSDPRAIGDPLKGNLAGLWRYRVGDYRLLCELHEDQLKVLVIRIGHRREVYR